MLTLLLLACAPEAPPAPCPLATDRYVITEDGATIALHHHPGKGPPVILVHGISSNHTFWDLDEDHSAARWLVRQGFDPWLLDLRGHGNARTTEDGTPQISGWTVDDYGRYDVAAAVSFVQDVTGYARVGYVGHSMGGMVGGIYVANGGGQNLSSFVVVGSPATFTKDTKLVRVAMGVLKAAGAGLFWVESGVGGDAAAALGPATPGQLQYRLYNRDHFRPETERRMLRSIASPMSREEMQQMGRMIEDERFESADRTTDWTAAFHTTNTPVLAIAGGGDEVGRPDWVRPWVAGDPSKYVEVPGYGHLDLGLGEDAEQDVFPLIGAWLAAHPGERRVPRAE